ASRLGSLHADTGAARLHVWRDTLGLVAARPLFGWGPDTFGLVFGRFVTGDWEPGVTFDRAHNLVLDLWAAQGLVGLAACGSFFLVWAVGCFRGRSGSRVGRGAGSGRSGRLQRGAVDGGRLGVFGGRSRGGGCVGSAAGRVPPGFGWPADGAGSVTGGGGRAAARGATRGVGFDSPGTARGC